MVSFMHSLSVRVSHVCLSLCLSVCLSVGRAICLSVRPSVCLRGCLLIPLSKKTATSTVYIQHTSVCASLYALPTVHMFSCISPLLPPRNCNPEFREYVYMHIYIYIYIYLCLYIYIFIYVYIYICLYLNIYIYIN